MIVFLAEPDGDDQEAIEYQRVYVDAAEYAAVADKQQLGPTRRAPSLSPSEQRRLRKGVRATKKRAEDEVRAASSERGGGGGGGGKCCAGAAGVAAGRDERDVDERFG